MVLLLIPFQYQNAILKHLTPDDIRQLMIAEDELARAAPLERIFPSATSHKYLKFLEHPRYHNRLLDAWEHRYGANQKLRDEGIALLRRYAEDRIHLMVPPQPVKKVRERIRECCVFVGFFSLGFCLFVWFFWERFCSSYWFELFVSVFRRRVFRLLQSFCGAFEHIIKLCISLLSLSISLHILYIPLYNRNFYNINRSFSIKNISHAPRKIQISVYQPISHFILSDLCLLCSLRPTIFCLLRSTNTIHFARIFRMRCVPFTT